jgi:hypothetical protein
VLIFLGRTEERLIHLNRAGHGEVLARAFILFMWCYDVAETSSYKSELL